VGGLADGLPGSGRPCSVLRRKPPMKPVYVLNGPNLNLLGARQPEIYGGETLGGIRARLEDKARVLGLAIDFRQSNHEGVLVDWIQEAGGNGSGLIVNAAAYTHTSIAMLDALLAVEIPAVEVHLSNIYRRETFRHHSHISRAVLGVICGFGAKGYELALEVLADRLRE
jgi:3-dehydroquinate dehydratase II